MNDKELMAKWVIKEELRYLFKEDAYTVYYEAILTNGFRLNGESVCYDQGSFDIKLGELYAREDAMRYLRVINDFMERDRLDREQRSGEKEERI